MQAYKKDSTLQRGSGDKSGLYDKQPLRTGMHGNSVYGEVKTYKKTPSPVVRESRRFLQKSIKFRERKIENFVWEDKHVSSRSHI